MVTTISPAEMTEDPLFHPNADLPDVSSALVASLEPDCNEPEHVVLPDGREVLLDEGGAMPAFEDTEYADVVESIPASGAPMAVADHREAHADALAAWNGDVSGCGCRIGRLRLDALLFVGLVLLGLRARRRPR
jgi:hypothetical protein